MTDGRESTAWSRMTAVFSVTPRQDRAETGRRPQPELITRFTGIGPRPWELWRILPARYVLVMFEDWSFNPGRRWRAFAVPCTARGHAHPVDDVSLGDRDVATALADPEVLRRLLAVPGLVDGTTPTGWPDTTT